MKFLRRGRGKRETERQREGAIGRRRRQPWVFSLLHQSEVRASLSSRVFLLTLLVEAKILYISFFLSVCLFVNLDLSELISIPFFLGTTVYDGVQSPLPPLPNNRYLLQYILQVNATVNLLATLSTCGGACSSLIWKLGP